ncbi:hypothetical protein [Epilithonimonas xixisoli]|uniref:hypothetical protein n=1 Tax=Epilithonimonas xixisoli TaxID=1476462 RepID=UPI0014170E70|nr:hypothetical protein [Epilithonimonas xixisoli]
MEILFCGLDDVQTFRKAPSTKKIATDSPTRAVALREPQDDKRWRGDCPNHFIKKPHQLRQGL